MARLKITLNSIDDIQKLRDNIPVLQLQLISFQSTVIRNFAETIILNAIKQKMASAGFSDKIIRGTEVAEIDIMNPKKVRIHFRSEYFSDTGFDVALAREKGTKGGKKFRVEPDTKKALHGHEKWPYFSKGHDVTGMSPLKIIETTVKELGPQLQAEYEKQLEQWIRGNMKGLDVST